MNDEIEHSLLTLIEKKFHQGVRKAVSSQLGFKIARYGNYVKRRRYMREWHIILIRRKYGAANRRNGLTDTQILDELERVYDDNTLKGLMNDE